MICMKRKNIIFFQLLVIASSVGSKATLADSSVSMSEISGRQTDYANNVLGSLKENISTYNGNLHIVQNDLTLNGSAGNDIVINRIYDLNKLSAGLMSPYKPSYEWTALGAGWTLRSAPRLFAADDFNLTARTPEFELDPMNWSVSYTRKLFLHLCNNQPGGEDLVEDLQGSTQRFYYVGNYKAVTKDHKWQVECKAGNISLKSADGYTYEYGNIDQDIKIGSISSSALGISNNPNTPPSPSLTARYMDAKQRTDLNGNWLKFEYKFFGTAIQPWPAYSSNMINYPYRHLANDDHESPSQLLSKVYSSDGNSVDFTYDENSGRLLSFTDSNNRKWQYQYSIGVTDGFLVKVISPTNENWVFDYHPDVPGSSQEVWNSLNFGSYVTSISPRNNQTASMSKLKSITNPLGGKTTYEYGFHFIQEGSLPHLDFSRGERLAKKTLSTGEQWNYTYTRGDTNVFDTTTIDGPEGRSIHKYVGYAYSIKNSDQLKRNTGWLIGSLMERTDPLGNKEVFSWGKREVSGRTDFFKELGFIYDDKIWFADLTKKVITRDGTTHTTEYKDYDAYGNPGQIVETGPRGGSRTTDLTYFNDTTKWIIGKPLTENLLKEDVVVGRVKRLYDANGNLITHNVDGVINKYTYNADGTLATHTNPNNVVTTYSEYKRGIPQKEEQAEGVTILRTVDDAGNVTSETNGRGLKTIYGYDGLGRVTKIDTPRGNTTIIAYTPTSKTATRGDLVETTNYDGFGRASDITLGGIKTTYKYDAYDNKTFESNAGFGSGTKYEYDALNRVTKVTNQDNTTKTFLYDRASTSITDERGNVTKYSYRSYGNPDEMYLLSLYAPVSAANVTITRNGRDMIETVKQGAFTRTYGYNSKYQLTSVINPETGTTVYGRDNAGNMTSRQVGTGPKVDYVYDDRSRLTNVNYPTASGTPNVTNTYTKTDRLDTVSSSDAVRKFGYDNNDNLLTETLTVDGITLTTRNTYNANDQLNTVVYPRSTNIVDYAPDVLGRPTQVGSYITGIIYWPSGQVRRLTYANGTITDYSQNNRLWPTLFKTRKGSAVYMESAYDYDGQGNLETITDTVDSSFNRTATYDAINRLATVQGPWGAGTINYDGTGNITKQTFGTDSLTYTYNGTTNLLTKVAGYKTSNYGYDAVGNVTSSTGNTYAYNAAPNLACINCGNSASKVEYSYDGMNKRISVTKGGVKRYEFLASNGNQLIEYVPSQNDKLTEYIYLGDKRIAQRVTP